MEDDREEGGGSESEASPPEAPLSEACPPEAPLSEAPEIEMGAVIEGDEDALAAAANTTLDMEGFETGAGFDLGDSPDELTEDLEVEAMEVKSSVFDEMNFDETDPPSSAGAGGAGSAVDGEADRTLPVDRDDDLGTEDSDQVPSEFPSEVPTDPSDEEPAPAARHSGLEELRRRQQKRSGARRLVTAASTILLLGGGGLAMAYWGVVEIPGITPPERSRFAVSAPVALPGPQPETPVMSHVIFVDSWREAETPRAWADALRERMPDLLGLVTPLSIDGGLQYALVVGPAYSAVEANDLMGPLTTAFEALRADPDSWAVREAPYSFFFGEYGTVDEANGRMQEIVDLAIPAYVLQVTYSGGGRGLRVYGGAFSDEVQAGEMGRLLSQNDLGDIPLTERRGRLPE